LLSQKGMDCICFARCGTILAKHIFVYGFAEMPFLESFYKENRISKQGNLSLCLPFYDSKENPCF
jgi:hypothetical protein